MNRFNSLVDVQHFDAQNSVKKRKKHAVSAVSNYSEHTQHRELF